MEHISTILERRLKQLKEQKGKSGGINQNDQNG